MYAAETIYAALQNGNTDDLSAYDEAVRGSDIEKDIYRSRNMRQVFARGFFMGGALANAAEISGGKLPPGKLHTHDDASVDVFVGKRHKRYPKPDGKMYFDKLSSVFATGNASRDDAPSHIRIQKNVPLAVALMWENMCPAQVYEVSDDVREQLDNGGLPDDTPVEVHVNASNCVQCGAITAKGGRLTPPEGGSGPEYTLT
jgi:electron-transferring-flavoprotein dehydrogenase